MGTLGRLSAVDLTHTAEYADHSTLRNVHRRVPGAAEECSYQCSKCRCAVGEEGRRETFLEGCAYFLVQNDVVLQCVVHILVILSTCIGSRGTLRPALFRWYWYCCYWAFVRRLPRNGTVQVIVYVRRVRALEHDRNRNHEKIVTLLRYFQSLLQVRSHLVLRKAHIVLYSLGGFSDTK